VELHQVHRVPQAQGPEEYTGPETHIATLLEDEDTSWVPAFTALCLADEANEEQEADAFDKFSQSMSSDIAALRRELRDLHREVFMLRGGAEGDDKKDGGNLQLSRRSELL